MNRAKTLQLTVALIKPDAVAQPYVLNHINSLIRSNFHVVQSRKMRLSRADAEEFYSAHRGRFFYQRAVEYMSSGELEAMVLAGEGAIGKWRRIMGPTKVYSAKMGEGESIRGSFGLSDTRNCVHGSDSVETAEKEARFFFPGLDLKDWWRRERGNSTKFEHFCEEMVDVGGWEEAEGEAVDDCKAMKEQPGDILSTSTRLPRRT